MEYKVAILDDAGVPGELLDFHAEIDDPETNDKYLIDDTWYAVVDVGHIKHELSRGSAPTTIAVVFCRVLTDPPKYLLALGGRKPSSTGPGGKVLQLGMADPMPRNEASEKPAVSSTSAQRLSLLKTVEFTRKSDANAPEYVEPTAESTPLRSERVFQVQRQTTGRTTLKMITPAIQPAAALPARPAASVQPGRQPAPASAVRVLAPSKAKATPTTARNWRRGLLLLVFPVVALVAFLAWRLTRHQNEPTPSSSASVEAPRIAPEPETTKEHAVSAPTPAPRIEAPVAAPSPPRAVKRKAGARQPRSPASESLEKKSEPPTDENEDGLK